MVKTLTMTVSGLMIYTKNQMVMVSMIILLCTLLSSWMFFMSNIHWFSVLLMLIYISGIMVLFMFIVSLSPNEKTTLKSNKKFVFLGGMTAYATKIITNSENSKIISSLEQSIIPIMFMVTIIASMAYLPPKVIKSFYKGMKSTK